MIDHSVDAPRDSLVAAVSPQVQDNAKSEEKMKDAQREDTEI